MKVLSHCTTLKIKNHLFIMPCLMVMGNSLRSIHCKLNVLNMHVMYVQMYHSHLHYEMHVNEKIQLPEGLASVICPQYF